MDLNHVSAAEVIYYGGGLSGLVVLGLSLLRAIGMRVSKDALTITEDNAHRDTIGMLQKRVDLLNERNAVLELSRNKLFAFSMSTLSYISLCYCGADNGMKKRERYNIEKEFQRILSDEQAFITRQKSDA